MVCTPLYVYNIYKVISMFGTQDIFFNLRIFASAGEKDMLQTLLIYVNAINQALFIIEMWRYPNGNKWRFIAIILASFMCAVAIMEKGALFFMLTVSLFILYEKGHIKIRTIILWGIILLFTFHGPSLVWIEGSFASSSKRFNGSTVQRFNGGVYGL